MLKFSVAASTLLTSYMLSQRQKSDCCGIIGIVSSKRQNIAQPLSTGVQLLKNRGYDSAGIVVFNSEEGKTNHQIIKQAEEITQTKNCIERLIIGVSQSIVKSQIGIGHTRWATCGQKVVKNAHPHQDDSTRIFIVHNGIINGYPQIKKQYLPDVSFKSQTDSEVIAQLIGKFRNKGMTMIDSIRETQKIIVQTCSKPKWGIVIMDKLQPDKIWTSTFCSPILIGLSNDEIYVASEAIAFKKEVDSYFPTFDKEIFELSVEKIPQIRKQMKQADRLISVSEEEKKDILTQVPAPYKSFYSYQIHEQAKINFRPEFSRIKNVNFDDHLTLIACGSSYYAALSSIFFFRHLKSFIKIGIHDPVEMIQGDISENETVVLVSQSGETMDLINIIQNCNQIKGVNTIGIINVEGSTIARKVTFPIYIKVGREVSVAATKSMFHQCLNLIMLAVEVATKKQSASSQILNNIKEQLRIMPQKVQETIQMVGQVCKDLAQYLYQKQSLYLLAMREALGIAKQAALKIKQLNYIHAQALGACQMKHGPIALIQSDKPKTNNRTFEILMNAVDQMYSRNAKIILVTNCRQKVINHYQTKSSNERVTPVKTIVDDITFISVPKMEYLSHLLCLIPMQMLVEQISYLKGIKPDMPRNLAKTVTVD